MKKINYTLILLVFLFGFVNVVSAEISVSRTAFCLEISDREPVGVDNSFSAQNDRLYFFSEILDAGRVTQIKHRWFFENQLVLEVDLAAQGSRWRTWSHKYINRQIGEWRVDVVDDQGKVIQTASCTVYE